MPKAKEQQLADTAELDPRWANFLDLYLSTGNAKASAIEAGFSENYANIITTRLPDKVRQSMTAALERTGVTSELIAEKIHLLLHAKKPVIMGGEGFGEEDDYNAIDKGIVHAMKIGLGGGYAPERSVSTVVTGNIKDFAKADRLRAEYEAKLLEEFQDGQD